MTIWFSSDPHLGHEMVAHLRGFESAVEHDAALRLNMKKQVRDGDTIYWLGDMAFNGWKERIQWFRGAFPYVEQHVILGNHDRAHPINSRAHAYVGDFLDVFNSASLFARVGYKGKGALLSHFPYNSDHTEADRYTQYRLRDEGKPLFHGHTHLPNRISLSEKGTPMIHVGLDAWDMKLVSAHDAFSLLP